MKPQICSDYRVAAEIAERLVPAAKREPSIVALTEAISQCNRWQRRVEIAAARRWRHAQRDATHRLRRSIEELRTRAQQILGQLEGQPVTAIEPSVSFVFHDLRSLRDEFESVAVDWKTRRLTVRTSKIVLDGIRLGGFEIRLCWENLPDASPYSIVAVDANPARADDSTTHPHVQNERLCEGEGASVIRPCPDRGPDLRLLLRGRSDLTDLQPRLGLRVAVRLGRCYVRRLRGNDRP